MLCQNCWQSYNPTEYVPTSEEWGECEECGDHGILYCPDLDHDYSKPLDQNTECEFED